jgi:peptidoglycan hydrolase-like protein with peptidoglycan-binding domain
MTDPAFPPGPRPGDRHTAFFADPMIDHLLRAVVTLTMEVSVTRERVRTLEALLAETGFDPARADNYVPDDAEAAHRARQRSKLIDDILGPMVSRLSKAD